MIIAFIMSFFGFQLTHARTPTTENQTSNCEEVLELNDDHVQLIDEIVALEITQLESKISNLKLTAIQGALGDIIIQKIAEVKRSLNRPQLEKFGRLFNSLLEEKQMLPRKSSSN